MRGLSQPRLGHPYRHGPVPHSVTSVVVGSGAGATGGSAPTTVVPAQSPMATRAARSIAARPGLPTKGLLFSGGGPIANGQPKVYVVFWGSQWGTETTSGGRAVFSGDPDGLAPYVEGFYAGLGSAHETWSAIATQYCQGVAVGASTCPLATANHVPYPSSGGVLAGVWEDTSYTPPTGAPGDPRTAGASGVMIAQEAARAATHFGDASVDAQYIIVSPTGTNPDGYLDPTTGYCAYHDNTQDPAFGGAVSGPNVAYTNQPYSVDAGASYCSSFASPGILDGVGETISHEYAETLTDPYPSSGWTDARGNEIADKCDYLNADQPGAAEYLPLATGTFAVQGLWANLANNGHGGCETSQSPVTVAAPAAKETAAVGTPIAPLQITGVDVRPGATLTFSATGLPPGLSVDPASGVISGTPTTPGRSLVSVQASDGTYSGGPVTFKWTVRRTRR